MKMPIVALAFLLSVTPSQQALADVPPSPEASWTFPAEADHLLFEARRMMDWRSNVPAERTPGPRLKTGRYRTYRIYGNGRVVIEPPFYSGTLQSLEPAAIDLFLRSLVRTLDLAAAQTSDFPPEQGEFVAVHLSHYADRQSAIAYLDALIDDDLDLIFSELAIVSKWLAAASGCSFWTGNRFPNICQSDFRTEHGLGDEPTPWCIWQTSQPSGHIGPYPYKPDLDARERLRQALRLSLQGRRLQDQISNEEP